MIPPPEIRHAAAKRAEELIRSVWDAIPAAKDTGAWYDNQARAARELQALHDAETDPLVRKHLARAVESARYVGD